VGPSYRRRCCTEGPYWAADGAHRPRRAVGRQLRRGAPGTRRCNQPRSQRRPDREGADRVDHVRAAPALRARPRELTSIDHLAPGTAGPHPRGRRLGFPTANIGIEPNRLVPARGAYAGRAVAPEGEFVAALSVGYRPTFGGTQLRVEAFLLDFEGDLYQQRLELQFMRYLHPDIKFPTPDDLVQQFHRDVADTWRFVSP